MSNPPARPRPAAPRRSARKPLEPRTRSPRQ
jgi:hypothetical protein